MPLSLTIFRKGLILVSIPFLFQLAFTWLVADMQASNAEAQVWASRSKEVLAQTQVVLRILLDAETGSNGFLLTEDPVFSEPYHHAVREMPKALQKLQQLVSDNPRQDARAKMIGDLVRPWLAWQGDNQWAFWSGDRPRAVTRIKSAAGKRQMDAIRQAIQEFLEEEDRLARERESALQQAQRRQRWLLWAGSLAAFGITAALALVFSRGISSRLATLTDNAQRLAQGKELAPPLAGSDEIARLDRAFREMAEELARSAHALRESAEEIRDLYNNAPCGYQSLGRDGTVLAINDTELQWLGYARDEIVGHKQFADLVTAEGRLLFQEQFARFKERGWVNNLEFELLRKDGTTLPVVLNSTAIRDAAGNYVSSRATLFDLTERKRAEDALRKSEDLLRMFVESALDYAIVILDPQGHVIRWNTGAEHIKGYRTAEILGKHFSCFYPAEAIERGWPERELRVARSQGRFEDEGWRVRKDGSRFWANVVVTALRNQNGELEGYAKLTRDLTERKRAEDTIRQLNEELEQRVLERTAELAETNRDLAYKNQENEMFVYSVSHDLRSPLVNLEGFSQELSLVCQDLRAILVENELPPAVRQRALHLVGGDMDESIRFIQTAVRRLSNIIDALLRLSRAGRVEYQAQHVDLNGLVARIVQAMMTTITERGAQVQVADLPPAWGDATAVEQVFANLIGNALHYLDPQRPGVIEVGSLDVPSPGPPEPLHTYYVRDNGLGIPDAYLHKVFQAFQRIHPEIAKGEGMGLAIVRRIVERHRGRVWVESKPGVGSTFFVTLPAADPRGSRGYGRGPAVQAAK